MKLPISYLAYLVRVMLHVSRCASIGGIERLVAAILLAVAVAGAVAFPRLLGRVDRVPAPGFGTHPPSASSVEAGSLPLAAGGGRAHRAHSGLPERQLRAAPHIHPVPAGGAPENNACEAARAAVAGAVGPDADADAAPGDGYRAGPHAGVRTAPTLPPVVVAVPAPVATFPVVPAVPVVGLPPGKVVLPIPTPVPLPVNPLPDRPPESQPIVVQQQRLLLTVTPPPPAAGDTQPVVTPPSVGIPAPIAPSPLGGGPDGGSSSG